MKLIILVKSIDHEGKSNPNWKGGKAHSGPYLYIKDHSDPRANDEGYVVEHRKRSGAKNDYNTVVHHKDGNKQNNSRDNLQVESRGEHTGEHNAKRKKKKK